jgi:hypothetical protein
MMSEEQIKMWDEAAPTEEISVQEMDDNLAYLRKLKEDYAEKDKVKKEAYAVFKEQEAKVIGMLEKTGKRKYVSDAGNATLVHEMSVKTPKTPEEKRAFFNWIREHLGDDAHDIYMSVNSKTLNGLYKDQTEEFASRGEVLNIPGLEDPITVTKLSFTKAK